MNISKQSWDKVRGWFHYPSLREPTLEAKLDGGAHFDFSNGEIKVGENFVREVTEKTQISEEECLEGLLTHEVGHYMVFPRRLSTLILSGKMINDFFKENQGFIFQTYADMCNDVSSVLDSNKRDPILRMRNASQVTLPDEVNRNVRDVMLGYLHRQAGRDYQMNPDLNSYLERMLTIEFLDPNTSHPPKDAQKLRLSLFQFGDIINDMLKQYSKPQQGKGGKPGGESKEGQQGQGDIGDIGDIGLNTPDDLDIEEIMKKASRGEIRKALREISGEISRGEYKQIREWLRDKGVRMPEDYQGGTLGIGTSEGELQIDREVVNYYRELSKKYPLIVHKKPVSTEKTKKSFEETEKWRVGKEPLLAMPHLSGNLFLPGITRKVRIKERDIKTTDYDIPHLLIAMDSSGSMPNPSNRKSYAVLAGHCAARSYHAMDSAVGVVNFSGRSFYLPYSRDLDEILGAVTAYQAGGTVVDVDMLKKMLRPEEFELYKENPEAHIRGIPREAIKKEVELSYPTFKKALESGSIDLLMFTDGGIGNLEEVVELFQEAGSLNRATIVLTGHYPQMVPQELGDKINVYRIDEEEDIPSIVLKDVRRNLDYNAFRYQSKK